MKKILFVDDEKDLHPIIMSYFPREQYRVLCASDGLEGIQKCRNEDFDLVILDYRMPKLDGVKFYQQLRDIQDKKKVEPSPVIFVSGFIDEVKSMLPKTEKCEFLSKPFSKENLYQKIQVLMLEKNKSTTTAVKAEQKIVLNPGDRLFSEGDEANCVYYVISGLLEGSKDVNGISYSVGKIAAGELIGEMAFINEDKRLLTITATEKSELIAIPGDKIMSIVNGQPKWIKLMIENLSKRLKDTIKKIA